MSNFYHIYLTYSRVDYFWDSEISFITLALKWMSQNKQITEVKFEII